MFCGTSKTDDEKESEAKGHFIMPGMKVTLRAAQTGDCLRIKDDDKSQVVSGGKKGQHHSKWIVRKGEHNKKAVRFQNNKNNDFWLRITEDNKLNAGGTGGKWTEFKVKHHEPYKVSLKAAHISGSKHHVGVKENGNTKKPSETGDGKDSWFHWLPVHTLEVGDRVHLNPNHHDKNLKVQKDLNLTHDGGTGDKATFVVKKGKEKYKGPGTLRLESLAFPGQFIRITKDDNVDAKGTGGEWTELIPVYFGKKKVAFRSYKMRNRYLAVGSGGKVKKVNQDGPDSWFKFEKK